MMDIEILTIFPAYFDSPLGQSLLGKAIAAGLVRVTVTDMRAYAQDKHRKVDDEPYGGGAGMVLMAPVVAAAIEARRDADGLPRAWTILMAPEGHRLDQARASDLAARGRILIVCGRYEGIDERVRQLGLFDEEISLGDFVLPGGESAALALTETVSRLIPGVVGAAESLENESFLAERLDYPHYTRPREFRGLPVPEVLLSGDHRKILRWRQARALARTRDRRPDLLEKRPPGAGEAEE
jgi:tRNA (guanine37-N1)-methyltransferase